MKQHRHRAIREGVWGWTHCVAPNYPLHTDRAHGMVVLVRTCRCGAEQIVEANAGAQNYGPWVLVEEGR